MKVGDLVKRVRSDLTPFIGIGVIIKMEEYPPYPMEVTVYWVTLDLYYSGYELSELELYHENR